MSLVVVELRHGAYLVGIGAVCTLVRRIAPACIEALEAVPYYLIAVHSLLVYAYLRKVEYLSDTHVIGDDTVIEVGLCERILEHFGDIVLGHELGVAVRKSSNGCLQSTVCVSGVDSPAVLIGRFVVGAYLALSESGLS